MQGLADGYFVAPYTIGDYLAGLLGQPAGRHRRPGVHPGRGRASATTINRWLSVKGTKSVDHYHRELGKIMWDYIGMARNKAGLEKALSEIPALRDEFRTNVRVLGTPDGINQSLEKAGRVADFFELAELMARDALHREESCGGHFRVEHQTEEGEAQRDDDNFAYVGAWEWQGPGSRPDPPQGAPRLRVRPPDPAELQVMDLTLKVWRQDGADRRRSVRDLPGRPASTRTCRSSRCSTCSTSTSSSEGNEPIAFDSDCREGICGTCGLMINGQAHGPEKGTATCQLHMRKFHDGDEITIEPWRAAGLPGHQGPHRRPRRRSTPSSRPAASSPPTPARPPDANLIPIPKAVADAAMDAAACIGCGACVAACPNSAGQLFTSAKLNAPQPAAPGPGRALGPHGQHGRAHGGVLRHLHQPRRVPGGVPEGDLHRLHRLHEPRLHEGPPQEPPDHGPAVSLPGLRPGR